MATKRERLHANLAAVCPIDGVGGPESASARIDYRPEATQPQRAAAAAVLAAFDWSDAAQQQWEADQHPERRDLRADAQQALADNATFLAIASPSNAQNAAQVRRLTQQNQRIIRRLVQLD
jgi:hypothetical protein